MATGDRLDTVSMSEYVGEDLPALIEYAKWRRRSGKQLLKSGRKVGFKSISEDKKLDEVSLEYLSFSNLSENYRRGRSRRGGLEQLKLRSPTQGVMYASPDAIMTRYGKFSWNDWTGAGETVPIATPFENRLNEFNRGKCYCEVVVSRDKKSKKDRSSESWWEVIAK